MDEDRYLVDAADRHLTGPPEEVIFESDPAAFMDAFFAQAPIDTVLECWHALVDEHLGAVERPQGFTKPVVARYALRALFWAMVRGDAACRFLDMLDAASIPLKEVCYV